jgi:HEAT repeat protein
VARLTRQLRDPDPLRRDAAVARLRIIGAHATDALTSLATSNQPVAVRSAALRTLDGIDDPRALDAIVASISDMDSQVAIAAISAARQWVTREAGTRVLEALTDAALDVSRDAAVRLAALDAVAELPQELVAPVLEHATPPASDPSRFDDPLAVLEWVSANGEAPLPAIHDTIVRIGEAERQEPDIGRRNQWMRARGAAHVVLGKRRSTVAVYDLREAFAGATSPLSVDFLTAVAAIGDASCLEPMARAWAATANEQWWQSRLSAAAADIVRREKLTGRSAVVKRVRAKWPGFV